MSRDFLTGIFLAFGLGGAGSCLAQIYQHVDEHGVVHFSDAAPAAEGYQVIDQAELDASTTTVPGWALPDATQERAKEESRERARASRTEALRRAQQARDAGVARCHGYRSRLDGIRRQLRAGYRIDEGNRLRAQRREIMTAVVRECRSR